MKTVLAFCWIFSMGSHAKNLTVLETSCAIRKVQGVYKAFEVERFDVPVLLLQSVDDQVGYFICHRFFDDWVRGASFVGVYNFLGFSVEVFRVHIFASLNQ